LVVFSGEALCLALKELRRMADEVVEQNMDFVLLGGATPIRSEWTKLLTAFYTRASPREINFICHMGAVEFGWPMECSWKKLQENISAASKEWCLKIARHPKVMQFVWQHMLCVAKQWAEAENDPTPQLLLKYKRW
jgi:hypothetical protein